MALAFVVAHFGVTAAIIGPRTMDQLDRLLVGADIVLSDEILCKPSLSVPPALAAVSLRQFDRAARRAAA
jgi:aryl-alcohol dehydrogenase-like predicted oxidoreductase